MRKGLLVSIGMVLSAMVALSGCSVVRDARFSQRTVSLDDVVLDDVVAVVPMSPPYPEDYYDDGGYVAFVKYDGTYDLVKEGSMENPMPLWDENGLFFSDFNSDYIMRSSVAPVVHKSHKRGSNQINKVLKKDGEYLATYNVGYAQNGEYEFEFVVTNDQGSSVHTLPYYMHGSLAECGGKIVALSEENYANLNDIDTDEHNNVYELREFDSSTGEGKIIAQHDSSVNGERVYLDHVDGVCVDDRFYVATAIAASDTNLDYDVSVMDVWDVESGERQIVPLYTDDGTNFRDGEDDPEVLFAEGIYLYGVETGNGRVSKINAKTGEAVYLNKPELPEETPDGEGGVTSNVRYDFTTTYSNGVVYQLVFDSEDEKNAYIRMIDTKTGDVKKLLDIPGLGEPAGYYPYTGLAINPNIDMERIK